MKYQNQIQIKDKVLYHKIKLYIILKQKKNLIMNLILKMDNFQEKEDLVKLENVNLNFRNLIQLKMKMKIYQVNLKVKLNLVKI